MKTSTESLSEDIQNIRFAVQCASLNFMNNNPENGYVIMGKILDALETIAPTPPEIEERGMFAKDWRP